MESLEHNMDKKLIIDYTNWLSKQDLMISEGVDGYAFRSSVIGGKKYSAEELYNKFVSEQGVMNKRDHFDPIDEFDSL